MERNIILYSYRNDKAEIIILNLRKDLFNYVTTQAQHDGQREEIITETEFNVVVVKVVETKIQLSLDEIKKILEPAGLLFNAKEAEEKGEKRQKGARKEINLNEHKRNDLCREKSCLPLQNTWKKKIAKWLLPIAIIFGVIDTFISYGSFRVAYPFVLAVFMALGVGAVVFTSHLFGHWVKKVKGAQETKLRIIAVLASALIFFTAIAFLRAQSTNSAVSVAVSDSSSNAYTPHVSILPFILISFLLFAISFLITVFFAKTQAERELDEKHDAIDKEIGALDQKQALLKQEVKEIPEKIAQQKAEARIVYYYMQRCIQECKSIGKAALAEYKKVYAQAKGAVPEFFDREDSITVDDTFIVNHKHLQE